MRKKQSDDVYAPTGSVLVDQFLTQLANEAHDLEKSFEKLNKDHEANFTKLSELEAKDHEAREQMKQAMEVFKSAHKTSSSIKLKQKNLVEKQQKVEEERNYKWAQYHTKSSLARELRSLTQYGVTYGVKRPAPNTPLRTPVSKQSKMVDGWFSSSSKDLPAFTKNGPRASTTAPHHQVKDEVKNGVKDEMKNEVKDELKREFKIEMKEEAKSGPQKGPMLTRAMDEVKRERSTTSVSSSITLA